VATVTAYIGLGANLAEPRAQLAAAFDELDRLPLTRVVARSSLYRSAPLGYAAQPDFVNAVARVETGLPPERLLAALHEIETRHGRERSFPNAPRTLDLDLLLYGDRSIVRTGLVLPHPRMHERAFVLAPLVELDPEAEIPGRGRAVEWLARCAEQRIERIAE
jgi:2-amino-4-hydroxy-6-hydroxymethyldihydropteridine diphosphokinase